MGQMQTPTQKKILSHRATDLRGAVISSTLVVLLTSIAILVFDLVHEPAGRTILIVMVALIFISFIFIFKNQLLPAQIITPLSIFLVMTYFLLEGDGVHDATIVGFPVIVVLAGLLLGQKGVAIFGTLTTVVIAGIAYAELNGVLIKQYSPLLDSLDAGVFWILNLASSIIVFFLIRRLTQVADDAKRNELIQIKANEELTVLKDTLEEHVEQRTSELIEKSEQLHDRADQLQAIADISQAVSLIKNLDDLLPAITKLISQRFDFYHVGIFLLDENREFAVLKAANSAGGQQMLARGHKLKIGQVGIVGRVAQMGRSRVALDVGEDATYFDNPNLPETHSEMALPLMVGTDIVGVLDVQSKQEAAFTEEDTDVFKVLANSVAVAVENTRLLDESRSALAEVQDISREYIRREWSRIATEKEQVAYRYKTGNVTTLPVTAEHMETQIASKEGNIVKLEGETPELVVPVKLRDEAIGVLRIRSSDESRKWQTEDIELVQAVAERTALAMENARLLDETSRRAGRERLVSDITTKIRNTNDPQAMIQTAMEELKQALGASSVQILPQLAQPNQKKTFGKPTADKTVAG